MQIQNEFYFSIVPEWLTESKVSDNAFRIYATLCRFADKDDGSCYPSIKTIANKCGKSPSSVKRGIKELKDLGIVTVEARYINKEQTSNLYTIIYDPSKVRFISEPRGQFKSDMGASSNMSHKPESINQSHIVKKDKAGRKQLYKTLCESLGYEPQTKTEISGFNKVIKEIAEAGGTSQEIFDRVEVYKNKWKGMTVTPFAIAKNWTVLGDMVDHNRKPDPHNCKDDGHEWRDLEWDGDYKLFHCVYCKSEKQGD